MKEAEQMYLETYKIWTGKEWKHPVTALVETMEKKYPANKPVSLAGGFEAYVFGDSSAIIHNDKATSPVDSCSGFFAIAQAVNRLKG